MNDMPNISNSAERPILSLPAAADFVPAEEFNIVKKLVRDPSIDLERRPLEPALQGLIQSDKKWKQLHVAIAISAYTDMFVTIKNDDVERRKKQFDEVLRPEDRRGHYFYRFLVGQCKFAPSKATKLATYLRARIQDGLTPAELETMMLESWRLERGYEEALQELESAGVKPKGTNGKNRDRDGKRSEKKSSSQAERSTTQSSVSSDGDDDPPSPKAGKKPRPAVEEEEADDDATTEKRENHKAIKIVGKAEALAGYVHEALARVRYSEGGRPRRIKYLSARGAHELAQHQLLILARRRFNRTDAT